MKPEELTVNHIITEKQIDHYGKKVIELVSRLCEGNPLHMAIVANYVTSAMLEYLRNNSNIQERRK